MEYLSGKESIQTQPQQLVTLYWYIIPLAETKMDDSEFSSCEKVICYFRFFVDVVVTLTILYFLFGNLFRAVYSKFDRSDEVAESLLKNWIVDTQFAEFNLSDVIGMDNEINDIREHVIHPLKEGGKPAWFRPPKGILIIGPPGSGKTMLTRAIANEAGCALYIVNPLIIMCQKKVHVSRVIPALFSLAAKSSPSIICIEDIDEILKLRPELESESLGVVRCQFMNYWDLVAPQHLIMVIGTTSFIDNVNPDIMSRMSMRYQCKLPDETRREEFIMNFFSGIEREETVNLKLIAERTNNLGYRELREICEKALESTEIPRENGVIERRALRQTDILMSLNSYLTTIAESED